MTSSTATQELLPLTAEQARALREENRTLYEVIRLVSSSLELDSMLQGVVGLATQATGCHACFIYLLSGGMLTIRAASPVFADAVGRVSFPVSEGLTGWVARHRRPEFIRERAMDDPRMRYVPLLREEEFQSMAAVPILSRAGQTIGVIVLHTRAPHEFAEDTLQLLIHIASLVSGAIENAQLFDRERRRVSTLTGLAELGQAVGAAADLAELEELLVRRTAILLGADAVQLLAMDGERLDVRASVPETLAAPATAAEVLLAGLEHHDGAERARALWPSEQLADLLVVPLTAGRERVGLLCAGARQPFSVEDAELARSVANLGAVAIRRIQLIEGLTEANAVKELFEALEAGAVELASARAAQLRCDLAVPYVIVRAQPAGTRTQATIEWRQAAERLSRRLAELAPHSAVEAGPGPVRALLSLGAAGRRTAEPPLGSLRELGRAERAVIGVSEVRRAPAEATDAQREAAASATIAAALLPDGGAVAYSEVGAYRYLVAIDAEHAPRDRMRDAVDRLIDYDRRRRASLLDTLERYLSERRSVIESARALYIHPNTLRQRLGRIETLTGLDLERDDLLSLELAIKLARLHGRPAR
ncbi:MAG TPA: GAF domain-containing protein [Solirubrobacteraceae bacterium]|nr:GAF domain-containing protein [Solirubrobacteraceae bacterium]